MAIKFTTQELDDIAWIVDEVLEAWDFSGDNEKIRMGKSLEKVLKKLQEDDYLLKKYMKYQHFDTIDELLPKDHKLIETDIIRYIVWLKQDQKLSSISISQYVAAIIHFYAMNDIVLNRKKIGRYVGDYIKTHKDRSYTYSEISQLLHFSDERAKALVLLLASTGVRIGSVPGICLRHLKRITLYQLYQVTIYEGTRDEYYTFTTPEAASAIDTYLDFRSRSGELLKDDSLLFRQEFDWASVRNPKTMNVKALSKLLEDKLLRSGLTTRTHETETTKTGQKRNEVPRAHGFRKFVETNMIRAKLQPEIREMLLGHDLPSNVKSYYRPDESEVLEEYLKAVDLLTINEENRLRRQVETLQVEKSQIDELRNSLQSLRDRLNLPDG